MAGTCSKRRRRMVAYSSEWSDAYLRRTLCPLLAHVAKRERNDRANLHELPVNEPVCNACFVTFWRNLGLPVRDDDSTEH